eukprot:7227718-Prymnesium_polylepis.1
MGSTTPTMRSSLRRHDIRSSSTTCACLTRLPTAPGSTSLRVTGTSAPHCWASRCARASDPTAPARTDPPLRTLASSCSWSRRGCTKRIRC